MLENKWRYVTLFLLILIPSVVNLSVSLYNRNMPEPFFGGLAIIISKEIRNDALSEIIRFICLSGIALSPIVALIFNEVEIGQKSAVGLVRIKDNSTLSGWVMNMGGIFTPGAGGGGSQGGTILGGIQIPIYVLIFGISGGYLRYLYESLHPS